MPLVTCIAMLILLLTGSERCLMMLLKLPADMYSVCDGDVRGKEIEKVRAGGGEDERRK